MKYFEKKKQKNKNVLYFNSSTRYHINESQPHVMARQMEGPKSTAPAIKFPSLPLMTLKLLASRSNKLF